MQQRQPSQPPALPWPADRIERWPIDKLTPYARNARTHSDEQIAQIAASMREWGWTNPILIDEAGTIIAGHGRIAAARRLGLTEAPVMLAEGWTDAQKAAYVLADNKLALNAGWDSDLLAVELDDLRDAGFDMGLLGFTSQELNDLIGTPNSPPGAGAGSLADRFMIPPFSVLNAREGWWQDRKRAWLALGIKSEMGRIPTGSTSARAEYGENPTYRQIRRGPSPLPGGGGPNSVMRKIRSAGETTDHGTSIFDPVLCEIAYRWFSPPAGVVLDPFAGGSVRGVVASRLGRAYVGHELREEQVEANRLQAADICSDDAQPPSWICGDSRRIDQTCADVEADFVFSCPPYADLEVYSDDPADLSALEYPDFRAAYFEIIRKACARLRQDRFACFVVGEVRGKGGAYYDFIGDTVQAFREAGLDYYNEAILITALGSLPIRVAKQFSQSRKLGKTHQNLLVFCKGDPI